jgi:dTDP-4-amino-4,6-dideoxygalactose transaminase
MQIPFNRPYLTGDELNHLKNAVSLGKISGNGFYTQRCHEFFEYKYGFNKCLLTTSCTDALEMAAILCDIMPGDEVIVPSYTFVSTANAFVLRGARIVFVDSRPDHPGMHESKIEEKITPRTKAIVPVHYAGVACDMDEIMLLAEKYNLFVIEDAAQAIDSYYKGKPLGSIGHFGCFSFHETKNIQCGEGGMLVVNDERFNKRAEIIWEKGTNRAEFFRGEVNKYGWVDIGSSFLPSEITAAFLYAQLENLEQIQAKRKEIWNRYLTGLQDLVAADFIKLSSVPEYATKNGHLFHILCKDFEERSALIAFLKSKDILSVFHYLPLHLSDYYLGKAVSENLPFSSFYSDCLLRLPLYIDLTDAEQSKIISSIHEYFND